METILTLLIIIIIGFIQDRILVILNKKIFNFTSK